MIGAISALASRPARISLPYGQGITLDAAMPTRPIRFLHRGAIVEVADAPPTRTLLDWLREDAHCTGTK
jgi:hypothetical protein